MESFENDEEKVNAIIAKLKKLSPESNEEKLRKIDAELDELFRYQFELLDRIEDIKVRHEFCRVSQKINLLMEKAFSLRIGDSVD